MPRVKPGQNAELRTLKFWIRYSEWITRNFLRRVPTLLHLRFDCYAPAGKEEAMAKNQGIKVSDEDIQEIIDANEAGTADLMAIYESAEARYFEAVNGAMPKATPSTAAYPAGISTAPLR